MSVRGQVPSDLARTNVGVTRNLTAASVVSNNITANTATIADLHATVTLATEPIDITVNAESPMDFSLENNASVYTPSIETVQLQANVFVGFPPGLPENNIETVGHVPIRYAPPIDQFLYASTPGYNGFPPFPFASAVSMWLKTSGELVMKFEGGTVGYMRLPVQFTYRLSAI